MNNLNNYNIKLLPTNFLKIIFIFNIRVFMINNVLWWPQNKNTQNVENIVRSHVTIL